MSAQAFGLLSRGRPASVAGLGEGPADRSRSRRSEVLLQPQSELQRRRCQRSRQPLARRSVQHRQVESADSVTATGPSGRPQAQPPQRPRGDGPQVARVAALHRIDLFPDFASFPAPGGKALKGEPQHRQGRGDDQLWGANIPSVSGRAASGIPGPPNAGRGAQTLCLESRWSSRWQQGRLESRSKTAFRRARGRDSQGFPEAIEAVRRPSPALCPRTPTSVDRA